VSADAGQGMKRELCARSSFDKGGPPLMLIRRHPRGSGVLGKAKDSQRRISALRVSGQHGADSLAPTLKEHGFTRVREMLDSYQGMASAMPTQLDLIQAPHDSWEGTASAVPPQLRCRFRPRRGRTHQPINCHLERSSFFAKRRSYAVERSPGAGEPNNAQGNSDKNPARWDDESAATTVILRQRSPWQSQGLQPSQRMRKPPSQENRCGNICGKTVIH